MPMPNLRVATACLVTALASGELGQATLVAAEPAVVQPTEPGSASLRRTVTIRRVFPGTVDDTFAYAETVGDGYDATYVVVRSRRHPAPGAPPGWTDELPVGGAYVRRAGDRPHDDFVHGYHFEKRGPTPFGDAELQALYFLNDEEADVELLVRFLSAHPLRVGETIRDVDVSNRHIGVGPIDRARDVHGAAAYDLSDGSERRVGTLRVDRHGRPLLYRLVFTGDSPATFELAFAY
jgi:hypothetical protein